MALPSSIIMRDTRANQPAATAVAAGTLYYVTDESVTEYSDGATWESYTDGGGSIGGSTGGTDEAVLVADGVGGSTLQATPVTINSSTGAITFPDNVRQTFNPGANAAGLNAGAVAGDPDTPVNGDIWYDSTANELTARINGVNVALGAGGGGDLGALYVQDQQTSGTNGGTFTSGAWQTRVLNTAVVNSIAGASLASNQITLPAGTYDITAVAPAFRVNHHQAKLYNITGAADLLLGASGFCTSSAGPATPVTVQGRIVLAGETVIELQHRCETTGTTTGFGTPSSWGTEVYADVFIHKVA